MVDRILVPLHTATNLINHSLAKYFENQDQVSAYNNSLRFVGKIRVMAPLLSRVDIRHM